MTTRLATILRYALGVVAVLLTVTTGRAATPSFDSFDTNDFRVVKTTAPWKILSNTANNTNSFTNVVVNYINSTIINTNTIITNVNTTIVNTNTTIVNQGDTIINTNVTQTFSYTTNIIDNSLTIFTNVVEITTNSITIYTNVFVTNATIFINGTNVGAINPTIGRLPYKSGTNTFDDSSMYFIDTNTTGTATLEVTDLASGGVVVSLPSGIVTNIVNGTGALTNDGAGNLGWGTLTGADLWTNNAGILEPVNLALPVEIDSQLRFGPGTTNVLYRLANDAYYTNGASTVYFYTVNGTGKRAALEAASDGSGRLYAPDGFAALENATTRVQLNSSYFEPQTDGAVNIGGPVGKWFGDLGGHDIYADGYHNTTNYSRLAVSHGGTNGVVVFDSQSSGNAGLPRDFNFDLNGTNYVALGQSGDNAFINLKHTSGTSVSLSTLGASGNLVGSAANSVEFLTGSTVLQLSQAGSLALSKGVDPTSLTIAGYINGTNNSKLQISHPGTNSPIIFDSQSSGDAGGPRPVALEFGGTNLFQFDSAGRITLGPGTTNILYRNVNTLSYSNNTPIFQLEETGQGDVTQLTQSGGIGSVSGTGGLNLTGQGGSWVIGGGNFYPSVRGYSFGIPFLPVGTFVGTNYTAIGYYSSGDYSQIVVHHTGTNGVGAGIVFDSQATGTGGSPRPFVFTNAPVQLPWFTSLQKTNLAEVANGMLIYQTDNTPGIRARVNGAWVLLQTTADP